MQMRVYFRYSALSLFALSSILIVAPKVARAYIVSDGQKVEEDDDRYKFQVALIYNRDHPDWGVRLGDEWKNFQCGGTLISIPKPLSIPKPPIPGSEPPSESAQDHDPHASVGDSGPPPALPPTGLPPDETPQSQGLWVLTAAHCVMDPTTGYQINPRNLRIYAGSYDYRNGQQIGVNNIFPHPLFDPNTMEYDVALIELAAPPVIPTTTVTAVDPNQVTDLFGTQAIGQDETQVKANTIGWGVVSDANRINFNFDNPLSKILQEVTLDVMQSYECNKRVRTERIIYDLVTHFNRLPREDAEQLALRISGDNAFDKSSALVTEHMICGVDNSKTRPGAVRKGTCFGDSGGPLLIAVGRDGKAADPGKVRPGTEFEFRQIGVTSFGPPETCGVGVDVFTNIADEGIHKWIKGKMSAPDPGAQGPTTSAAPQEALSPTSQTQEQGQKRSAVKSTR
jgi:secreted trypsin-like serine protease